MIDESLVTKMRSWEVDAPEDVVQYINMLRSHIVRGEPLPLTTSMGPDGKEIEGGGLGHIFVEEFRLLFCTSDAKWADVRSSARKITEASLMAIAGWVAGTLGIMFSTALAAASFVGLFVARFGIEVFCKATVK